jgi:hypothetical protein
MRLSKPLIAAALAISMSSTAVLAQSAAPLSVASRSGIAMQDTSRLGGDHPRLIPALVIIAVLAAAILLVNNDNGPSSP